MLHAANYSTVIQSGLSISFINDSILDAECVVSIPGAFSSEATYNRANNGSKSGMNWQLFLLRYIFRVLFEVFIDLFLQTVVGL